MRLPQQSPTIMRGLSTAPVRGSVDASGCNIFKAAGCVAALAACAAVCVGSAGAACVQCLIGIGAGGCIDCV